MLNVHRFDDPDVVIKFTLLVFLSFYITLNKILKNHSVSTHQIRYNKINQLYQPSPQGLFLYIARRLKYHHSNNVLGNAEERNLYKNLQIFIQRINFTKYLIELMK